MHGAASDLIADAASASAAALPSAASAAAASHVSSTTAAAAQHAAAHASALPAASMHSPLGVPRSPLTPPSAPLAQRAFSSASQPPQSQQQQQVASPSQLQLLNSYTQATYPQQLNPALQQQSLQQNLLYSQPQQPQQYQQQQRTPPQQFHQLPQPGAAFMQQQSAGSSTGGASADDRRGSGGMQQLPGANGGYDSRFQQQFLAAAGYQQQQQQSQQQSQQQQQQAYNSMYAQPMTAYAQNGLSAQGGGYVFPQQQLAAHAGYFPVAQQQMPFLQQQQPQHQQQAMQLAMTPSGAGIMQAAPYIKHEMTESGAAAGYQSRAPKRKAKSSAPATDPDQPTASLAVLPSAPPLPPPPHVAPMSKARMDAEARATRIRKHNEAEVRRRQRLKHLLEELAESVGCTKCHKSAILRAACERVRLMSAKLSSFGVNVPELLAHAERNSIENGAGSDDEGDDDAPATKPTTRAARSKAARTQQQQQQQQQTQMQLQDDNSAQAIKLEPGLAPSSSHAPAHMTPSADAMQGDAKRVRVEAADAFASVVPPASASSLPSFSSPATAAAAPSLYPPCPPGVDHHALFHSAGAAMDIIDSRGNVLDCNEAFATFTGYPREILINSGTTFLGLTHPDSLQASFKLMTGLISGGRTCTRAAKKYVTAKGQIRNTIITCWLVSRDALSADASAAAASATGPFIQAMIEEIPLDSPLDQAYFQLPYQVPSSSTQSSLMSASGGTEGTPQQ